MTSLSSSQNDLGHFTGGECRLRFEERFAKHVGTEHAVAVSSGAMGLQLVIRALGLQGEVIVPAFIAATSIDALIAAGVTPILADLHPNTLTVDPQDVARKITLRTEALIVAHTAGHPADVIALQQLSEEHGLRLIEECGGGVGAAIDEHRVGSFEIGCFSLDASSAVTTGEGGMIATSDDELAQALRELAGYETNTTTSPGFECRMADLNAAVGSMQLGQLEDNNRKRRQHVASLRERLQGLEELRLPLERPGTTHVYQRFYCQVRDSDRDSWVAELQRRGIDAQKAPQPIHQQAKYRQQGFHAYPLPATDDFSATALSLPVFPEMTAEQLERLGTAVIETATRVARETPTAAELLEWWQSS
ncbi:MAG: DegT/DnrJ/EryC1/StrS family aminotransferase [Planctomycetota bacterium]